MKLTLPIALREKLANLPETGMGFQRVAITLASGESVHGLLVFNGRDLEAPAFLRISAKDIVDIALDEAVPIEKASPYPFAQVSTGFGMDPDNQGQGETLTFDTRGEFEAWMKHHKQESCAAFVSSQTARMLGLRKGIAAGSVDQDMRTLDCVARIPDGARRVAVIWYDARGRKLAYWVNLERLANECLNSTGSVTVTD